MMPLAQRLAARIRAEGPLRFDAFQEAALYDPDGGYYERAGRVGRSGDFVTGPSWHPAFGRTIARIAQRLVAEREEKREEGISVKVEEGRALGRSASSGAAVVDIVDVGAGEGELLSAADEALRAWGIRDGFRLVGVERSATRRADCAESMPERRGALFTRRNPFFLSLRASSSATSFSMRCRSGRSSSKGKGCWSAS